MASIKSLDEKPFDFRYITAQFYKDYVIIGKEKVSLGQISTEILELHKKIGTTPARIISGIIAEIVMVLGYFIFEGFMYGFVPSAVNIPANAVQGVAGLILGVILIRVVEKNNIMTD